MKRGLVMALGLLTAIFLSMSGQLMADSSRSYYTDMSAGELARHLVFDQKGFELDKKVQEGGTLRERLRQDKIQKLCSAIKGNRPDAATAAEVQRLARESMEYPDGGLKMGDSKKGEKIAMNAFGYRVGHRDDDHSAKTPGGMCINCHVLDSEGSLPGGSLGPSLEEYGVKRGQSEPIIKYTYEMIYNPHVYFPCTNMPRIGANGVLSKEQIRDVVGYLLDPASGANTR
jgi:sulfur-oxidizing protein SoxX